jgi:glycosyltransferase involved in cell wall biosynthesis
MSSIVGLFTDVLPPGGVQRAGRHVAAVTARFAADRGINCDFASVNDPRGPHTVRVGCLEFKVSGHTGGKLGFVRAALRLANKRPSLVIALHPHLAPVVSLMKWRSPNLFSIVFTHGVEVWQPLSSPRRVALQRADLVLAPSADTVKHLVAEQGVSPSKVRRLPWALDPEFEARVAAGAAAALPTEFPRSGRTILTVGRWDSTEKYKGADTLISALPLVLKAAPDASLVLVGDGNDRRRLEQLARDLGVSSHTHFLSGLTPEQLSACYAACDLFALPSRGEGFGMVFLEAMAHGKPVIGGGHGGIPDIVEEGKNGLLVPHGDIERLADALQFILADPARANAMGSQGRQRVATHFSFAQFETSLTELLSEALSEAQTKNDVRTHRRDAGV